MTLFPATRISAIEAVRSDDDAVRSRGYEALIASYWKPVYKYVRIRWNKSNEDAQDLTQEFFARCMEKDFFHGYDPSKAAFRTFLRVCLDGFLANENQAAKRQKRGGGAVTVSLDFEGAESELQREIVAPAQDMDEYFHREWLRHLFSLAAEQLRHDYEAGDKTIRWQLFEQYDLQEHDALTYDQLAARHGISVSQVTNALAAARRDFRRILLDLDADAGSLDQTVNRLQQTLGLPDLSGTKYRLIEEIGRGGMGTVYLARDVELERDVALKVLHRPDASSLRESRILARLEHPSIVPVHDAGTLADGRVFYVMKRVEGRRLDQLRDAKTARADLLRVFEKICEAVAFAHSHGVIHRDLKPANIMVGSFGEALIMDWGVAKLLAAPADVAAAGSVIGTPGYMAPEQARGETDLIDARSDVYALGAILQFLLAGRERLPRPLQGIVSKSMAADRGARYAGAQDLASDVARFAAGEPVTAYRENVLERAGRLFTRYQTAILLVVAYVLMRSLLLFFTGR